MSDPLTFTAAQDAVTFPWLHPVVRPTLLTTAPIVKLGEDDASAVIA
jgi:hypothetical protein